MEIESIRLRGQAIDRSHVMEVGQVIVVKLNAKPNMTPSEGETPGGAVPSHPSFTNG